MLGHLKSIVWEDGSIPLLNDAAFGIAPTSEQIFDYAKRLGVEWKAIPMKECGYRKMKSNRIIAIVDVGNITATYQPGHSHADTFSYEMRIDGKPFITDTGISTYDKTPRRQYERSTLAHNTVVIGNSNSSNVWGGFRVGNRAKISIIKEKEDKIIAEHDGYGKANKHRRTFTVIENGFRITDSINATIEAVNYIHFEPEVRVISFSNDSIITDMGQIEIKGASSVEIKEEKVSRYYNRILDSKVARMTFSSNMEYIIRI